METRQERVIFRPKLLTQQEQHNARIVRQYTNGMVETFNADLFPGSFLQGTRTFADGRKEQGVFDADGRLVQGAFRERKPCSKITVDGGVAVFKGVIAIGLGGENRCQRLVSNSRGLQEIFVEVADLLKDNIFATVLFYSLEEEALAFQQMKEGGIFEKLGLTMSGYMHEWTIRSKCVLNEESRREYANGMVETFSLARHRFSEEEQQQRVHLSLDSHLSIYDLKWNHGVRLFPSGRKEEGWFLVKEHVQGDNQLMFGVVTDPAGNSTKVNEIPSFRGVISIEGKETENEDLVAVFEEVCESLKHQTQVVICFSGNNGLYVFLQMQLEGVLDRLGLEIEPYHDRIDRMIIRSRLISDLKEGTLRIQTYHSGVREEWSRQTSVFFEGVRLFPNGQKEEGIFDTFKQPKLVCVTTPEGEVKFVGNRYLAIVKVGDESFLIIEWKRKLILASYKGCSSYTLHNSEVTGRTYCPAPLVANRLSRQFILNANQAGSSVELNDKSRPLMEQILFHPSFIKRILPFLRYVHGLYHEGPSRFNALSEEAQSVIHRLPTLEQAPWFYGEMPVPEELLIAALENRFAE